MKLKVFTTGNLCDDLVGGTRAHLLPFEIHNDSFEFTHDISEAQIIPVFHGITDNEEIRIQYFNQLSRNQIILIMQHTHHDDNMQSLHTMQGIKQEYYKYSDHVLNLHTNSDIKEYGLYHDHIWDRSKIYYTDNTRIDLTDRLWTNSNIDNILFKLLDIELISKSELKQKKLLSPNRTDPIRKNDPRNILRRYLHNYIKDEDCYRGDIEKGYVLASGYDNYAAYEDVVNSSSLWQPINNFYYMTSFVSVYAESVVTGITKVISEKTYDPLIKGHFILPFGYSGIIKDLKAMGFLFPDWIDYSYDDIEDGFNSYYNTGVENSEKFKRYLESIDSILSKSIPELRILHDKDKHMLAHNREVFYKRGYDNFSDKIYDYMLRQNLTINP